MNTLISNSRLFEILTVLDDSYSSSKTSTEDLRSQLSFCDNCTLSAPWLDHPIKGKDSVIDFIKHDIDDYYQADYHDVYITEIISCPTLHEEHYIYPYTLSLCIEKTTEEHTNEWLVFLSLNSENEIKHIRYYRGDSFSHRSFYTYITICPAVGDVEIEDGMIRISEANYMELYFFLQMVDLFFDEYDDNTYPVKPWRDALQHWETFIDESDFDTMFEKFGEITYDNWETRNFEIVDFLSRNGKIMWERKNINAPTAKALIEWTDAYIDHCTDVVVYGF